MKKFLTVSLLAIALMGCDEKSANDIYNQTVNGVVLIQNRIDENTGGSGTGFILEDNQIITNHHVIEGQGKIKVFSSKSGKEYDAQVVYSDPISDIAVLRLNDWKMFKENENAANLILGNSNETRHGDKIVVIGHPWGLQWSVSEGIISGKHRRIGPNPKFMDQVDANLFQGNSGGPIFDETGKVVCVSTMMLAMEGGSFGFCVPSNLVKKILHDFNTIGEVRWRVLNVSAGLTEDGQSVIVSELEQDGAAAKAGIQKGDAIVGITTPKSIANIKPVSNPNDLITELALINGNNEEVILVIERNGNIMEIKVQTNYRLSSDYTPDAGK
jgi:S1-C subfamily serine protease